MQKQRVTSRVRNPPSEGHVPRVACMDPVDEEDPVAALAEMERHGRRQSAAQRITGLGRVAEARPNGGRDHKGRVRDDQVERAPPDGLQPASVLEGEVVESVQNGVVARVRKRAPVDVDSDHAFAVAGGEQGVKAGSRPQIEAARPPFAASDPPPRGPPARRPERRHDRARGRRPRSQQVVVRNDGNPGRDRVVNEMRTIPAASSLVTAVRPSATSAAALSTGSPCRNSRTRVATSPSPRTSAQRLRSPAEHDAEALPAAREATIRHSTSRAASRREISASRRAPVARSGEMEAQPGQRGRDYSRTSAKGGGTTFWKKL